MLEDKPIIPAQALSDEQKSPVKGTQRAALAAVSGAHFVHDGIADSFYLLLPFWTQSLGLSYLQAGSLRTAYSAAMAVFQMPSGLLAEKAGERALLVAGTLLAGGAFAALALANSYVGFLCLILITGVGSAVQHPLASSVIARAYAAGPRRAALGVYNFAGDMGKMIVAFGIAVAAGLIGWRASAAGYGLLVVAVGLVLLLVLRRLALGAPVARSLAAGAGAGEAVRSEAGWGFVDRRGYELLSGIHIVDSASRTGCLTLLPFLLLLKHAESATVGLSLALVFAGGAAGKLACGLLSERLGIIRTVALTELATAGLLLLIIAAPLMLAVAVMPLLGIALNGTSSVLYGTVAEFVRSDKQARAFGLFYTLGSAAGGSAPIVFGALSDWLGVPTALSCLAGLVLATLPLTLLLGPHVRTESTAS